MGTWLNHYEAYSLRSPAQFEAFVHDREAGIHAELDAALRLHRQREPHIEDDVHNVRLAELGLHRDRIARHCRVRIAAMCRALTFFLLFSQIECSDQNV